MVRKPKSVTSSPKSSQLTLHIGRRLAALRASSGRSTSELALQAGLSSEEIASYEAGKKRIPFVTLYDLANALGVTVEYFLEDFEFDPGTEPHE